MGRGLISEDVINQVRDRVDIAEVVGHHVSLTRAGQNLKGLCPFHQEKSPSFTVSLSPIFIFSDAARAAVLRF